MSAFGNKTSIIIIVRWSAIKALGNVSKERSAVIEDIRLLIKPCSIEDINAHLSGLKWWVKMCSEAKPNPLF
jgi:hypothetical protein